LKDLTKLARAMQEVLTETADSIARETGFIKRQRKVTGSNFAQSLVFSFLSNSDATSSRIQTTAAAVGLNVARQSLEERYTPECAEFLRGVLVAATAKMADSAVTIPLFDRFTAVEVLDSSIVALPDELADVYRGGKSGTTKAAKASLKMTVGLDLKTGRLRGPELAYGRTADLSASLAQADPPRRALQLADLNYFSLEKFARWGNVGAYWLSRLKVHTTVYDSDGRRIELLKRLRAAQKSDIDIDVRLGTQDRLACRLLARRVPADVARIRRQRLRDDARRRNVPVSELALELADWTVVVTNIPRQLLSVDEAMILARLRWQIELVFKLWKSHGGIDEWSTTRPYKALCAVYAKLLAMVVQHWTIVTGCWNVVDRSPTKAARVVGALALSLAFAIRNVKQLCGVLKHAVELMRVTCRMEHHKSSPNAYDRILCYAAEP
jgi:hypothetical protein